MARCKDRTEDFKDAVQSVARSSGYTESEMAQLLTSLIMHKPLQRSSFMQAALKTLESIGTLEDFIAKHRKDYIDLHRSTEHERDSIEHEVSAFIKACKDQIDVLKNKIIDDEKNRNQRTWLGVLGDDGNADIVAHKHGVVLTLSERLCLVTAQFDRLRSIRFQEAISKTMPRRKPQKRMGPKLEDGSDSVSLPLNNEQESHVEPVNFQRSQQQLLDDETRALQVELSTMLDAVQDTERKMIEMSALNHLMSTHVLQQAEQIEYLYQQAVEATTNVQRGNKELSKAIERNRSGRTFLFLFIFVITFSILFLDWYS